MSEPSIAEQVLLHFERDVKLTTGETVVVRPWGVKTFTRMSRRINTVISLFLVAYQGKGEGLKELIANSYEELVGIAAESIGWDFERLYDDKFMLEDVVKILNAVVELNFTERPELGKAITVLAEQVQKVIGQVPIDEEEMEAETSEKPSSSSSPTDTEKTTS
jgi:hypothetical protein